MKLALVPIVSLLAACGDDPITFSQPVNINLKAKSDDTQSGVVTTDKGITTESSNPYGAFVSDAMARIGGEPSRIEVDLVELSLGGGSMGVAQLGEVFDGNVELLFQMNDTNNSYSVATQPIDVATTAGPIAFDATFESDGVPDADYDKLLGGGFKVVLRGPAAAGFEGKGADADLQARFTFAAFE